jgi:hypothetical protein
VPKLVGKTFSSQLLGMRVFHKISNDNGVRVVNFATSINLTVKSAVFPHRNIHKFTRTSPDGKMHNQIDDTEGVP